MTPEPCKTQVGSTEPLRLVPPANAPRNAVSDVRMLIPRPPALVDAAQPGYAPPLPLGWLPPPPPPSLAPPPPVPLRAAPPPPAASATRIVPPVLAPVVSYPEIPGLGAPPWRVAVRRALDAAERALRAARDVDAQKVVAQLRHTDWNKLIVSAYKLTGFAVLTVIVFGLLSYMGSNLFYAMSSSWLQPTLVSATDEHVLPLRTKLTELTATRDRLAAELADRDRAVAMHEDYAKSLRGTLEANLEIRLGELKQLTTLRRTYTQSRHEIVNANRAFSQLSRLRTGSDFDARLIDRDTAINGNYQRFQIANGNLAFQEKAIDIVERADTAARDADGLAAILNDAPTDRLTVEVLRIKQEYRRSQLDLAKARDDRKVTAESLGRYEELVTTVAASPYLRAMNGASTIALVPYENVDAMKPGAPLYACRVGLFFCSKVGRIVDRLDGEVAVKHPVRNQTIRGQTLQVQLDEARWARHPVLFAGSRPVLF
jgi:hypothetical protein